MTLSIVIVSWNVRNDLERCLESLTVHPPSVAHEVIVVDNASTDGTPARVRERFPAVRLIEAGTNLGFAAATNLGIRQSAGTLLLMLNPDTRVPPAALDRMIARLEETQATVLGPRIVDGSGRPEISCGPAPTLAGEAFQKIRGWLYARHLWPMTRIVERQSRVERRVDWVSGACLLVRRDAAERVGLLDERFFLYWEDVDFCDSIREGGGTVLFSPAAEIVHLRGRSAAGARQRVNAAYRRGQLSFYEKHGPRSLPILSLYLRLTGRLPD